MKSTDTIIFSLCIGFFVIAVYETIVYGISYSYWWFMLCLALLLAYNYRRRRHEEKEEGPGNKKRR